MNDTIPHAAEENQPIPTAHYARLQSRTLSHADTFTVRRLTEDESGTLCATDESHDLSIEHADNFVPAMSIGRI